MLLHTYLQNTFAGDNDDQQEWDADSEEPAEDFDDDDDEFDETDDDTFSEQEM